MAYSRAQKRSYAKGIQKGKRIAYRAKARRSRRGR